MEQVGEHETMPLYKGSNNGNDVFIYWQFDEDSDLSGNWYIGEYIYDSSATVGNKINEPRYCPHEPVNGWRRAVHLECRQSQQQPTTPTPPPTCCRKYVFAGFQTYFTLEEDRLHDEKPVWKALIPQNGITKRLFWRFNNVPDPRPVQAVPGTWCFGDDVDDRGASISSESLGHQVQCPADQRNTWTFPMDLKCASGAYVKTCEEKHEESPDDDIFNGNGEELPGQCKVERVLYDLAGVQADQVAELTQDFSLRNAFDNAVVAWQKLTSNADCGFVGTNGYAPTCNNLCFNIKELNSPKEFQPLLNAFADNAQMFFAFGFTGECKVAMDAIFTEIAKFQKYVGVINNLPAEFQEYTFIE